MCNTPPKVKMDTLKKSFQYSFFLRFFWYPCSTSSTMQHCGLLTYIHLCIFDTTDWIGFPVALAFFSTSPEIRRMVLNI